MPKYHSHFRKQDISSEILEARVDAFMSFYQKKLGITVEWDWPATDQLELCKLGVPAGTKGRGGRFMERLTNLATRYGFCIWLEQLPARGYNPGKGTKKTRSTKATERFYEYYGFFTDDFEGMEFVPPTYE